MRKGYKRWEMIDRDKICWLEKEKQGWKDEYSQKEKDILGIDGELGR